MSRAMAAFRRPCPAGTQQYIVTCQAHLVLVKQVNQMCGLFFKGFYLGGYLSSAGWRLPCRSDPPVDGPKDPWPRVLSLPGRFVEDPASLARDNILL